MTQSQSDGALFWKIEKGRTPMPSFQTTLSEEVRWGLVHYLRTLASPEAKNAIPAPISAPPSRVARPKAARPAPRDTRPLSPAGKDVVSRQEHDALRAEFRALKARLDELTSREIPERAEEVEERLELVETTVRDEQAKIDSHREGTHFFHAAGYGFLNYIDDRDGPSSFAASFNPIFMWSIGERLLVHTELEISVEDSETELGLEYLDMSYDISDNLTLKAGKFLTPATKFGEDLHPTWINKLPDTPLFLMRGLAPISSLGVEARGGVTFGRTSQFGYSIYLSNGGRLGVGEEEEGGGHGGGGLGRLAWDNYTDFNDNKAIGGRLEYLPVPSVEIGYAAQSSNVGPIGIDVDALMQTFDFTFTKEIQGLRGRLNAQAAYVWLDIDEFDYGDHVDSDFDNEQSGGYAQLAYRPSLVQGLMNWEWTMRYDWLNLPDEADHDFGFFDEQRWTLGTSYWLSPSVSVTAAYQWDDRDGESEDNDRFMFQFSYGF